MIWPDGYDTAEFGDEDVRVAFVVDVEERRLLDDVGVRKKQNLLPEPVRHVVEQSPPVVPDDVLLAKKPQDFLVVLLGQLVIAYERRDGFHLVRVRFLG